MVGSELNNGKHKRKTRVKKNKGKLVSPRFSPCQFFTSALLSKCLEQARDPDINSKENFPRDGTFCGASYDKRVEIKENQLYCSAKHYDVFHLGVQTGLPYCYLVLFALLMTHPLLSW